MVVRVVAVLVRAAAVLAQVVPFRGRRVSRVRFCWQAQHLVTPGVGVGEFVLGAGVGRCGVFPRSVLRSAGFG